MNNALIVAHARRFAWHAEHSYGVAVHKLVVGPFMAMSALSIVVGVV